MKTGSMIILIINIIWGAVFTGMKTHKLTQNGFQHHTVEHYAALAFIIALWVFGLGCVDSICKYEWGKNVKTTTTNVKSEKPTYLHYLLGAITTFITLFAAFQLLTTLMPVWLS